MLARAAAVGAKPTVFCGFAIAVVAWVPFRRPMGTRLGRQQTRSKLAASLRGHTASPTLNASPRPFKSRPLFSAGPSRKWVPFAVAGSIRPRLGRDEMDGRVRSASGSHCWTPAPPKAPIVVPYAHGAARRP